MMDNDVQPPIKEVDNAYPTISLLERKAPVTPTLEMILIIKLLRRNLSYHLLLHKLKKI